MIDTTRSRSRRAYRTHIAYLLSVLCLSLTTEAQTNLETNAGVQFNFSAPGAASLGQGGAFLGLAYDATAAYANPAGLTNILEPEFHLELRSSNFTHIYTNRGRLEGIEPTQCQGVGVILDDCIDTVSGLRDGEANNTVLGTSFFSYVYPWKKWAFAVYRHELANFEANFSTDGAFLQRTRARSPLGFPAVNDGRLASLRNEMRLEIVNYGFSTAYRIHPNLSLGLGLSSYDFTLQSRAERFLPDLFALPDFDDLTQRTGLQTQDGDDKARGLTAGFLWDAPSETWSIGGVYRQGPDFEITANNDSRDGPVPIRIPPDRAQQSRFHVPDVYGLGLAFKPNDRIRIALDYLRIEYSDLIDDLIDIFDIRRFGIDPELDSFVIDDANEIRLGFEYSLHQARIPLLLRVGTWYDPDHSLRFEGTNPGLQAVYRRRGDAMHYSIGAGIALRKVQVDAAFDYSDRVSTASLSVVFRH